MDHNPGPSFATPFSHSSDYLQPEHDAEAIEPFVAPGTSHASTYTNCGAVDPRRDGSVPSSTYTIGPIRTSVSHAARYGPESGLAGDNSYRAGNNFSDSSSNSIAASPSSGSSHYAYNSVNAVPVHQFTALPTLSNSVLQQPPVTGYPTIYRSATTLDNTKAGALQLPTPSFIQSPSSIAVYPSDRDHYAQTPILHRAPFPVPTFPAYDTPRLTSNGLYAPHAYGNMNSPSSSQSGQEDCSRFPWPNLEGVNEVYSDGRLITPDIAAQVEKGFFQDPIEKKWTCYRRNYFSVGCSYTLSPFTNNGQLYMKRGSSQEPVKSIAVRISAAVDGVNGKVIELVQHTPKRDAGPKMKVKPVRMLPKPSNARTDTHIHSSASYPTQMMSFHQTGHVPAPYLSLQFVVEPEASPEPNGSAPQSSSTSTYGQPQPANQGSTTQHTFERIQFKCATANNGKRRASQQYFHLVAELLVDIRKEGAENPVWQAIAKRTSEKIVVRGRSPSHYQNEGAGGSNGRTNGATNGRYGSSISGGISSGTMSYGTVGGGSMRSPISGHSSAGASMGYSGMGYGPNIGFRPQSQYTLHESSGDSASSPDSVHNGDAFDTDHSVGTMVSHSDRAGIHDMDGYSYHPSPIYDAIHHHHLPVPKIEGPRISTDPRQHAFKTDYPEGTAGSHWQLHGPFGRYQGFETSKNVFPDVGSGAGSYS